MSARSATRCSASGAPMSASRPVPGSRRTPTPAASRRRATVWVVRASSRDSSGWAWRSRRMSMSSAASEEMRSPSAARRASSFIRRPIYSVRAAASRAALRHLVRGGAATPTRVHGRDAGQPAPRSGASAAGPCTASQRSAMPSISRWTNSRNSTDSCIRCPARVSSPTAARGHGEGREDRGVDLVVLHEHVVPGVVHDDVDVAPRPPLPLAADHPHLGEVAHRPRDPGRADLEQGRQLGGGEPAVLRRHQRGEDPGRQPGSPASASAPPRCSTTSCRRGSSSARVGAPCDGTAADGIREHYNIHRLLKQV